MTGHGAQHPCLAAVPVEVLHRPRPFVVDTPGSPAEPDLAADRVGDFAEAPFPGRVALTWLDHRDRRVISRPGRGDRLADQAAQHPLALTALLRPAGRQQPLHVRHGQPARAVTVPDRH